MKLFFIAMIALLAVTVNPAYGEEEQANNTDRVDYSEMNLFGGGVSFGYYNYGFVGSRSLSLPPVNAYFEFGLHEYLTGGPFIGFARWNYDHSFAATNVSYHWNFFNVGARASFHLTGIFNELFDSDVDEKRIDWYVSLMSGLELRYFSTTSEVFEDEYDDRTKLFFGPISGIRYYLGDNFALYLEGGRGALGLFTFGVSTRL